MKRFLITTGSYTLRLTAVFILASIIALLASSASFAQTDGGIGGRPANPIPGNDRTKSIFIKTLEPGQKNDDAVVVVNNSSDTKTILVYATDSTPSSGGAFACAQALETATHAGTWIALAQNSVDVPANSTVTVPFSITVPNNAEPGEQNGCIVLQEKKDPTIQSGVGLSFRTAIRVAILVSGDIEKSVETTSIAISHERGKIILSPKVKNTGNVSIDADVTAYIKTVFGAVAASQDNTFPILRSQVTEWNFELNAPFWGGFYKAGYALSYDKSNNYIGSDSKKDLTTLNGDTQWFFVAPHPLAALIELGALVALVFAGWQYYGARIRKNTVKSHWKAYTVASGEQIVDIAKRRKTSWKLLAKVNKLQAPYTLTEGQSLLVPVIQRKKKQAVEKPIE